MQGDLMFAAYYSFYMLPTATENFDRVALSQNNSLGRDSVWTLKYVFVLL